MKHGFSRFPPARDPPAGQGNRAEKAKSMAIRLGRRPERRPWGSGVSATLIAAAQCHASECASLFSSAVRSARERADTSACSTAPQSTQLCCLKDRNYLSTQACLCVAVSAIRPCPRAAPWRCVGDGQKIEIVFVHRWASWAISVGCYRRRAPPRSRPRARPMRRAGALLDGVVVALIKCRRCRRGFRRHGSERPR